MNLYVLFLFLSHLCVCVFLLPCFPTEYGPIMSFSLYHGLRWLFPSYIIIYIPHSCWELEAVGVELPDETVLEHQHRINNRCTLFKGHKISSALSMDDISLASSRGAFFKENSAMMEKLGRDVLPPIKTPSQFKAERSRRHTSPYMTTPITSGFNQSDVSRGSRRPSTEGKFLIIDN